MLQASSTFYFVLFEMEEQKRVVQTCDDSGDDNALQEFCMAANAPALDSSSSSSGASSTGDVVSISSSSSDSSSSGSADTDGSELQAILAKCVKK